MLCYVHDIHENTTQLLQINIRKDINVIFSICVETKMNRRRQVTVSKIIIPIKSIMLSDIK